MILTVTPNVSADRTYVVEDFGVDRTNRASECHILPGGKGINVARVLKELGREAITTGYIGGCVGEAIVKGLDKEQIRHDFVGIEDNSRLCIKVVDPKNSTQTEINESGPFISAASVDRMFDKIRLLAPGKEIALLCGSCPPGVPATFYYDIIKLVGEYGVKCALDASGEHLAEGIKAGPFIVKPNVGELSELAGTELCTLEEISRAAKSLKQYGVEIIAVTMGRSGGLVTDGVQVWKAVPPEISFASAVGSGDAFLAAFIDSLLRGESLPDALVWGVAAGAANATSYGAGLCSKYSIIDIRKGVTLSKVS